MRKISALSLLLLLAGCSVEKPLDASDPKASAKWVSHCHKQAVFFKEPEHQAQWYIEAYNHAEAAGILSTKEEAIPDLVKARAKESRTLDAFVWAMEHGATPPTHYTELMEYAKLRGVWKEQILARNPEAFPVLMSLALDFYDIQFFNAHAADQIARGFEVKSPMEKTEFKIRFRRFVGEELADALEKDDVDRIRELVPLTPKVLSENYLDARTRRTMQAAGNYVFTVLKDEQLAIQMLELRYAFNPIDFSTLPFGEEFLQAYRSDPEYVIRNQGLAEWDGPMTEAEAQFLTTLPESAWDQLANLHFEELLELSMKMKESDAALRLIAYKAKEQPLVQADYNELISWALKYSNKAVFDFAMAGSGELDIYNIDFASLALNQKLFQQYAMQIMKRIYYTMDTNPRPDGTTLGRIKQVFACGNENAGLYIVHNKYGLSESWVEATGGKTLLMEVCEAGNLRAARYLIEKRGEDVRVETGYSKLEISVFGNTRPKEGKLSPIFFAAKSGNPELIKYLVSKGANVNARSNFHTTPLMHAISAGHIDAVKMLISLRANVNAQMNSNLNSIDLREIGSYDEISTPYRRARNSHNQEMFDLLLQAGARP